MKKKCIVLVGMAGVGKSTVGKSLSMALNFKFLDVDDYIQKKEGKALQEIINEQGEQAFLEIEKQRMCEIDLAGKVVSPGGSIIYHPDLMEYLKRHSIVVYLDDSIQNIEKRLTGASTRGIVGLRNKTLKQIYEERKPLYARYADITINCQDKSWEQIGEEILQQYSAFPE